MANDEKKFNLYPTINYMFTAGTGDRGPDCTNKKSKYI